MARSLRLGPIFSAAFFLILHLGLALALFHWGAGGHAENLIAPDTGPADDLPGYFAAIFWYPASYLIPATVKLPGLFLALLVLNSILWAFAFYLMIIVTSYLDIRPDEEEGGSGKPGEAAAKRPPPKSWKLFWVVFAVHFVLVVIFVYCRSSAFISWMQGGAAGLRTVLLLFLYYPIGPLWGKAAAAGLPLFPLMNGACWAFVVMHATRWAIFLNRRARGKGYTPPFAKG